MKKLYSRLILCGVLLLSLLVISVSVLLITFDPNKYVDTIAAEIESETGSKLSIDGLIDLQYYPWLSLEIPNMTLSQPATGYGDKPFIKTGKLNAKVKLLPLLFRKIEMDTLVMHDLSLNLIKNKDGASNWQAFYDETDDERGDDEDSEYEDSEDGEFFKGAVFLIGGVDIQNANIYWRDEQAGVSYLAENIQITTDALQFDTPINLEAQMKLSASKPKLSSDWMLKAIISYQNNRQIFTFEPSLQVDINTPVLSETARFQLDYKTIIDLDEARVQLDDLRLSVLDTTLEAQLDATDLSGESNIAGTLHWQDKNISKLARLLNMGSLAQYLERIPNQDISLQTTFNTNLRKKQLDIEQLLFNAFDNELSTQLQANLGELEHLKLRGKLDSRGNNLSAILMIVNQFVNQKETSKQITKKLKSIDNQYTANTEFDIDFNEGAIKIDTLAAEILGIQLDANLTAQKINTKKPLVNGQFSAKSTKLLNAIDLIQHIFGDQKISFSSIPKSQRAILNNLNINANIASDPDNQTLMIKPMSMRGLGLSVDGNLTLSKFSSSLPEQLQGQIDAHITDMPILLKIISSIQADDQLYELAERLDSSPNKSLKTTLAVHLDDNRLDLPKFKLSALGFDVNGNLSTKSNHTISGKISIQSTTLDSVFNILGKNQLKDRLDSIKIDAQLSGDQQKINIKPLKFDAVFNENFIKGSNHRLTIETESAIDIDKGNITVDKLKLNGIGLQANANLIIKHIYDQPAFSGDLNIPIFNPRHLLNNLDIQVNTASVETLKKASLHTNFSANQNSIQLDPIKILLDNTNIQGKFKANSLDPLNTTFNLHIDSLNLDDYLPAKESEPNSERSTANTTDELPLDSLRQLKMDGIIEIDQLTVAKLKLEQMSTSFKAGEGMLHIKPRLRLYSGGANADIKLDMRQDAAQLALKSQITDLQLGALLNALSEQADITGLANLELDLGAGGNSLDILKKTLNGTVTTKIVNGVYHGMDIPKILRQIEIMIESKRIGDLDQQGSTTFTSLTALANIKDGIIRNDDLLVQANGFDVTGAGILADLNNNTWDYNILVKVNPERASYANENYNLGGYDLEIKCSGDIASKRCLPDLKTLFGLLFKGITTNKIKDKIFDKLGIPSQKEQPQDTQEPPPEDESEQLLDAPKKLLDKGLKKLLDF